MSSSDDHIREMRWLYDDDASYKEAIRKIKLDELREIRQKEIARDLRKSQRNQAVKSAALLGKKTAIKAGKEAERVPRKLVIAAIGIASIVLIAVIVGKLTVFNSNEASNIIASSPSAAKAPFKPLITPKSNVTANQINYDSQRQLLTYPEKVGSVNATISQQPFPKVFLSDPGKFKSFLDSIPERVTYPVKEGNAYLAVGKDGKVQYSVIATTSSLVFVRTTTSIAQTEWIRYLKALQ